LRTPAYDGNNAGDDREQAQECSDVEGAKSPGQPVNQQRGDVEAQHAQAIDPAHLTVARCALRRRDDAGAGEERRRRAAEVGQTGGVHVRDTYPVEGGFRQLPRDEDEPFISLGPLEQEHPLDADQPEIEQTLTFLKSAERLKTALRSGWTSAGQRESVAEHSWRLCLMALVFAERYPDVDFARLIRIRIIHDLGEALSGDVPAPVQAAGVDKSGKERADLMELLEPLPRHLRQQIVDLWDEYEAAVSPEAKLAKALDKLETIMQHNQGQNPADFDYRFNLEYGRRFTEGDPFLAAVRATLDRETEEHTKPPEPGFSR